MASPEEKLGFMSGLDLRMFVSLLETCSLIWPMGLMAGYKSGLSFYGYGNGT